MGFIFYLVCLILFAFGNVAFAVWKYEQYHYRLTLLRKGLYSFFVITICVALIKDVIQVTNWSLLVTLAIMVVFLDISMLLTPRIKSFFKTEFDYEESVVKLVMKNQRLTKQMIKRVGKMSEMVQNIEQHLKSGNQFMDLKSYLQEYTIDAGLKVDVVKIIKQGTNSTHEDFKNTLETIENRTGVELSKKDNVEKLFNSEMLSLREERMMIVPIWMEQDELLIVLQGDASNIVEIDGVHMTNLVYLYYEFS